jgi:hypothetical protein
MRLAMDRVMLGMRAMRVGANTAPELRADMAVEGMVVVVVATRA